MAPRSYSRLQVAFSSLAISLLILRSRLAAFGISVVGALLLAFGGYQWAGPVPGLPVGASLEGFEQVQRITTSAGQSATASVPLVQSDGTVWRVVVDGSLLFHDEPLPADLLATGASAGEPLLRLGRGAPKLLGVSGTTAIFTPTATDGEALQVRIDTDPLVARYLMKPSEAAAALKGAVAVELWKRTPPKRGPAAGAPFVVPGLLLLAFGAAMGVVGARIRAAERSPVLRMLDQIERRIAALRKAIDPADLGAASLLAGLDRAGTEARKLAEGIERRGALLRELGPDTPVDEVKALRAAIAGAAKALEAIDASVAEAAAHVRSREASAAARDVEEGVATSLAARAALARQVESLREADDEMERMEGRAPRQREGQ